MRSEYTFIFESLSWTSHGYIKLIGPRIKDYVNESTINLSSKQINIGL